MSTHGVTYVAWGQQFIDEAVVSCKTHSYPTCLITDDLSIVPPGIFTHVIQNDFSEYAGLGPHYRKMAVFTQSPFDVTMFSDSECLFLGDVSMGFRKAEQFGFALTIAPGQTFLWLDVDYIHYSTGLMFFKGHLPELAKRSCELAGPFWHADEPGVSIAIEQLGINPFVLPEVFNYVPYMISHPRLIRNWHSRRPPNGITHITAQR